MYGIIVWKYNMLFEIQTLVWHSGPFMFNLQSFNQHVNTLCWHMVQQIDLQHGTLDHAIEHGRSRASTGHWLFNIKVIYLI